MQIVTDQGVRVSERDSQPLRKSQLSVRGSLKSQTVELAKLPEAMQMALADLDVNGDGHLNAHEIAHAVNLLKYERSQTSHLRKSLCVAIIFAFLLAVANLATSMVAEFAMRRMDVRMPSLDPGGRRLSILTDTATATATATADLVSTAGHNVATAASHTVHDLADDFGDATSVVDVKHVLLEMQDGMRHTLNVIGATWYNTSDVDMYTSVGQTLHKHGGLMFLTRTTFGEHRGRKLQLCGGICDAVVGGLAVKAISSGASYMYNTYG